MATGADCPIRRQVNYEMQPCGDQIVTDAPQWKYSAAGLPEGDSDCRMPASRWTSKATAHKVSQWKKNKNPDPHECHICEERAVAGWVAELCVCRLHPCKVCQVLPTSCRQLALLLLTLSWTSGAWSLTSRQEEPRYFQKERGWDFSLCLRNDRHRVTTRWQKVWIVVDSTRIQWKWRRCILLPGLPRPCAISVD